MTVANGEHACGVATAAIIAAQRFVNVPLRQIEPPLLKLNRRVRKMRLGPQQLTQIRGRNAKLIRRLGDIHAMSAESFNDDVMIDMFDAVGNAGLAVEVAHGHGFDNCFSNSAILARRSTISERLRASSMLARRSSIRPGRGWTRNGPSLFSRARRGGAVTAWRSSVRTDCER
jgi:hypothetical protein